MASQYSAKQGKAQGIFTKIRYKTRMSTPPILLNIILDILIVAIRQVKEIDGLQGRKEEVQVCLFEDDLVLCTKNSKGSTTNLLQLMNIFNKIAK